MKEVVIITIQEKITLFASVLQGEKVVLNANNPKTKCTISSDGFNWLVDNEIVSTIENQKRKLEMVLTKCELVKELMEYIGLSTKDMFGQYNIMYSNIDDMILLTKEEFAKLTFIYMNHNYITIEQINKQAGTMRFDYFSLNSKILSHTFKSDRLSVKSLQILKENERPKTQNFYYDMLFDGIYEYSEMLKLEEECEKTVFLDEKILQKSKYQKYHL